MAQTIEQFLGRLERAASRDEIQGLIVALRDYYRIDHVVYHWVNAAGAQYGCGTYPQARVQRYLAQEYLRTDPVVIGCFRRFHPVDWKRLDWSGKAARGFLQDAIAHGIGNQGYSIPIRGPHGQFALFSLSHHTSDAIWQAFTQTHRRDLIVLAHTFNAKALEFGEDRHSPPARSLSPREIDALTFLAMGYSRGQVAAMLAISEHTLRTYIESARLKLSASNVTHAVARALVEGLIIAGAAPRKTGGVLSPDLDEETQNIGQRRAAMFKQASFPAK